MSKITDQKRRFYVKGVESTTKGTEYFEREYIAHGYEVTAEGNLQFGVRRQQWVTKKDQKGNETQELVNYIAIIATLPKDAWCHVEEFMDEQGTRTASCIDNEPSPVQPSDEEEDAPTVQ